MVLPLPEKVLSLQTIKESTLAACQATTNRWEHKERLALRPVETRDLPSLLTFLSATDVSLQDTSRDFQDFYHGILSEGKDGNVCAAAIFYLAYSTWDSRYIYINHIHVDDTSLETSLMYTLADVAIKLDCHRLVWQHYDNKAPYYKELKAETLEGWMTLRMDAEAIDTFLATKGTLAPTLSTSEDFTLEAAVRAIDEVLVLTNTSLESRGLKLHRATEEELDEIEVQVAGLALYEKEPESVHVNKEHYRIDGYQTDHPLFHCLLLQDTETKTYHGMGFFYFGYDFDKGRFLYLEDLFFEVSHRGRGGGEMVMYALASVCKRLACTGFVWQALDWNFPAITFYKKIGAVIVDGLRTTRFAGANLRAFSESRPENL